MRMDFEGIENVRELGGLGRADGARIKHDVLLRTGKLTYATDRDVQKLRRLGLWAVIDFRDKSETRSEPDRRMPDVERYHLPALPDLGKLFSRRPDDGEYTPEEVHREFHELYRYLALSTESHDAYTKFFEILLESEGRPVLWHCTQGKDRTGVAAMLLLAALGFDEETIVQEYLRTNDYMQEKLDQYAARGTDAKQMALAKEVFLVFQDNARYYLRCVELEYGTIDRYLELVMNVGPDEIRTLQEYYLEEIPLQNADGLI